MPRPRPPGGDRRGLRAPGLRRDRTSRWPRCPAWRERTLTISSGGKTFSFTGWKVGWVERPGAAGGRRAGGQAVPDLHQPGPVPARHRPRPRASRPTRMGRLAAELGAQARPALRRARRARATTCFRPAATYFATTDIAPVAPGLSAQEFCLALPERCGVVAIPSSVFYDPADRRRRADAGALGLLQAGRRPGATRWPA